MKSMKWRHYCSLSTAGPICVNCLTCCLTPHLSFYCKEFLRFGLFWHHLCNCFSILLVLPFSLRITSRDYILRVVSCELSVASCQLRVVSCELSVASCQLRVVSCELSVASCQLRVVSCELSVACCQLRVVSCELSVASCQLRVGFSSCQFILFTPKYNSYTSLYANKFSS